jgi:hypothetical protein
MICCGKRNGVCIGLHNSTMMNNNSCTCDGRYPKQRDGYPHDGQQ